MLFYLILTDIISSIRTKFHITVFNRKKIKKKTKTKKTKTPKTKKLNAAHQILSVETIFCNLSHHYNFAIPQSLQHFFKSIKERAIYCYGI